MAGQIKHAATVTLGKMLQSKGSADDVVAPYMRAANVQPDGVLALEDASEMWFGAEELAQLSLQRGDVVVVEGGQGGFGRAAFLPRDLDGWGFQNSINRLRPIEPTDGRYLAYYLIALRASGFIHAYCNVVSMPHLTAEKLARLPVPLPPGPEQRAIAGYLDRETAQIDTLIAKQEQLITTLRERRQALIDHAFAQASSGSRMQLRRAIDFLTSGSRGWGDYYADQGERFVRIGNLPRTRLELHGEIQFVDLPEGVTEGERTRLREGDLLFSITAYLGSVAVVSGDWVDAYVSQHVALCRLNRSRVSPRCIGYFMLTSDGQHQLKEGAFGGTKLQLALDDVRGLEVPDLPLKQQRTISAHLDEETAKIDALIAKTERFIELSKERRTSLITAAVTGQIDVRVSA